MSDAIKDLISQILDKDFVGANSTVDAILGEKIQDHLDEEEMKIAAKLYNDIDYDEMMAEEADQDDDDDDDDEDNDDEEDLDEEVEELDELSGAKLGSYYVKAKADREGQVKKAAGAFASGMKSGADVQKAQDTYTKHNNKANKRQRGMNKAMDKLTGSGFAKVHAKEETEIQELSKKTLASYTRKAANDVGNRGVELGTKRAAADEVDRMTNRNDMKDKHSMRDTIKKSLGADHSSQNRVMKKAGNRLQGIDRATSRLEK